MPLETPALENLSVLTGKYGDEGDQLLFRILNSGDFLSKTSVDDYDSGSKTFTSKIAEKGLKYDLTVPFARYVVMNRNDIAFPFKRYQIQPVWRADRPQKGRYREFYQCDADIIGTKSLVCEAELLAMVTEVYRNLNFQDYEVSLSSRKILEGIAEACGASNQFSTFCTILDKLDKIGLDKVKEELNTLGLSNDELSMLESIISLKGNNMELLDQLAKLLQGYDAGSEGISEVRETLSYLEDLQSDSSSIKIDFTLARGLSYYTGIIYEVKPTSITMGSLTAGGRYDNLTGVFGMEGVSGVGISFGIDRIYDVLAELDLFPDTSEQTTRLLLTNFDVEAQQHALGLLKDLRTAGISSEVYPEPAKLKKQMTYANKKNIPFVLMIGSREIATGTYTLKNMASGEQEELELKDLLSRLRNSS